MPPPNGGADVGSRFRPPNPGFAPAPPAPTRGYGTVALRALRIVGSASPRIIFECPSSGPDKGPYPLTPQGVEESPSGRHSCSPGWEPAEPVRTRGSRGTHPSGTLPRVISGGGQAQRARPEGLPRVASPQPHHEATQCLQASPLKLQASLVNLHPSLLDLHPSLVNLHAPLVNLHPLLLNLHPSLLDLHASLVNLHPSLLDLHPSLVNLHAPLVNLHPLLLNLHPSLLDLHASLVNLHPSLLDLHASLL